jgi:hypothetical protein
MSRTRTALVGVVAAGLMLMSAGAASASEPVQTTSSSVTREVLDLGNGWFINSPTKTDTTTTVSDREETTATNAVESRQGAVTIETRTVGTDYKAQIQQPINPDGTSTWPAKRGVIPVQFKLTKSDKTEQRTVTQNETRNRTDYQKRTVTSTHVESTKTPSFQSVSGPNDTAYSVLGLYDNIPAGTTVADITKLQSDFSWQNGSSSHGGSLRWDIGTSQGDIHVYYGDADPGHQWTGGSGSGVNLMDATDDRFDPPGGVFYSTKQQILTDLGSLPVNNVSMVVDSCWDGGDQKAFINSATVGIDGVDHVVSNPLSGRVQPATDSSVNGAWVPAPELTSYTNWVNNGNPTTGDWTTVSTSNAVQTNDIPAKIRVEKLNGDPTPADVMEDLSSAQGDTTNFFRQIDGKYMYNLKAETLGKGSFKVYMEIDGTKVVISPGVFELK